MAHIGLAPQPSRQRSATIYHTRDNAGSKTTLARFPKPRRDPLAAANAIFENARADVTTGIAHYGVDTFHRA